MSASELLKQLDKEIQLAKRDKQTATFVTLELLEQVRAKLLDPTMPKTMPLQLHEVIYSARRNTMTDPTGSRTVYEAIREALNQPPMMFVCYATLKQSGQVKLYKYLRKEKAEEAAQCCRDATNTWSNVSPVMEVPFENSDNRVNKH